MKYHNRKIEKIYCLSKEDRNDLIRKGTELFFDKELNNYYWFLETVTVEETGPDFFQVCQNDWTKLIELGYVGENDIREIIEWFEFEHRLSYTCQHHSGFMMSGSGDDILESNVILDGFQLRSFISIQVRNVDERSKWELVKDVINEFFYFFDVNEEDEIVGPDLGFFNRYMRGEGVWMKK